MFRMCFINLLIYLQRVAWAWKESPKTSLHFNDKNFPDKVWQFVASNQDFWPHQQSTSVRILNEISVKVEDDT